MTTQETVVSLSINNPSSRDGWRSQYDGWLASGQSKAAYCRDTGLNAARFYYYCRVFDRDEAPASDGPDQHPLASPAFLPLTFAPEPAFNVRVQIADVVLSCDGTISGEQLGAWLRAIRGTL